MDSDIANEDELLGIQASSPPKDKSEEINTSSSNKPADSKNQPDIDEDDELLLLSSPSPPINDEVDLNKKKQHEATVSPSNSRKSPSANDIADTDDELEILEETPAKSPRKTFDKRKTKQPLDKTNLKQSKASKASVVISDEEDIDEDLESDDEEEFIEDDEAESEESESITNEKINIFYSNGAFFLWNADDVHMLREECRIVGKLTGCLPRAPRQNAYLGLPLQLMPEEARLLVDIDAASVVVEEPVTSPTKKIREAAVANVRQKNAMIHQTLYKEDRKKEIEKRMGQIIAGKKAKRKKLREEEQEKETPNQDQEVPTGSTEKENNTDLESENNPSTSKEDSDKEEDKDLDSLTVDDIDIPETSEKESLVQLFTENPWKRSLRNFFDWKFPSSERELLRYLVFKDLWGKGFYLTSGSKFGGDFLVYPGDPARYHSHYIAICKSKREEIPCLDIISAGRLASNVRKTALLCALDRNQRVLYTSLTWTGIS